MRTEKVLVRAANALSDVEEGIACAGTALESKTFTVGGKAFLFIGPKNARLKLAASVSEAQQLAKQPNSAIQIGAGGWAAIRFEDGDLPSDAVLARWVAESHALFQRSPARRAPSKAAAPTKPKKAKARRKGTRAT